MNKRGQYLFDAMVYAVIIVVVVLFLGVVYYGWSKADNAINSIDMPKSDIVNKTIITENFSYLTGYVNNLRILGIGLVIGMFMTMIVSAFFLPSDPPYLVGYILVSIVAVVLSIVLAWAWASLDNTEMASDIAAHDPAGNFILNYLPLIVIVTACIGGYVLFTKPRKENYVYGGFG